MLGLQSKQEQMKRKKIIIVFAITFLCNISIAQVGINNSNPQQAIHISGIGTGVSQPIIQIDGLNSNNNTAHENASSIKRVFATLDGDLVILANDQTNIFNISPQIATKSLPAGTETSISTHSFTLEYPSYVHFEARPTLNADTAVSAAIRSNGQARQIGFAFKFISAPSGVAVDKGFGNSYITWSSYSSSASENQLTGDFIFNPKKDLILPKGNYNVALYGFIQNSDADFITNYTNQTTQTMRVSISPISY